VFEETKMERKYNRFTAGLDQIINQRRASLAQQTQPVYEFFEELKI